MHGRHCRWGCISQTLLQLMWEGGLCFRRQELQARVQRLDGPQERLADRAELLDLLSLSVLYSRLCSDEAPFERKAMRAALDVHTHVRLSRRDPPLPVALTCIRALTCCNSMPHAFQQPYRLHC